MRDYEKDVVEPLQGIERLLAPSMKGSVRKIGHIKKRILFPKHYDTYAIETYAAEKDSPTILLTAGIHGDEPAPVRALLDFFEKGIFEEYSKNLNFEALACINPYGYEKEIHENSRIIFRKVNINRDFVEKHRTEEAGIAKRFLSNPHRRYIGAINIHEDNVYEAEGDFKPSDSPRAFYLYEISREGKEIGKDITQFLSSKGIDIHDKNKVYDDHCEEGVVTIKFEGPPDKNVPNTLEEYLRFNSHSEHILTFETPVCWPMKKRIEAHHLAMRYALDYFRDKAEDISSLPPKG